MSAPLPPAVLKTRLDIALGLFDQGGLNRFLEWAGVACLSGREAELLLIEAMLQVVSQNDEFTAASALLAKTFRDRLTEARDGLV